MLSAQDMNNNYSLLPHFYFRLGWKSIGHFLPLEHNQIKIKIHGFFSNYWLNIIISPKYDSLKTVLSKKKIYLASPSYTKVEIFQSDHIIQITLILLGFESDQQLWERCWERIPLVTSYCETSGMDKTE